jgi:hypothetical protein
MAVSGAVVFPIQLPGGCISWRRFATLADVQGMFRRLIGIAYSGAAAPVSRLRGLQVYETDGAVEAAPVHPLDPGARHWCRKEVATLLHDRLTAGEPCVVALAHGLSFPLAHFRHHALESWDAFLRHFCEHWPTASDHMYVEFARDRNAPHAAAGAMRLCDTWTAPPRNLLEFDVPGSVARAAHAGIPWLKHLRDDRKLRWRTHFWPFDGFSVDAGRSVVAEVHPALVQRRYPEAGRNADQQAAYALAMWLKDMQARGALRDYFNPPLTLPERRQAQLEGWILGVR